jgi:ABC-2 type transport system permease protein
MTSITRAPLTGVNIIGTWTLYKKEVHRFIKVYNQTIIAPVITSLLFLAVFSLAIGSQVDHVGNIKFSQFMAAGLIMMSVVQNAFANTSSSFIMGKVLGIIIDYLTPPISAGEMVLAMTLAGVTRGLIVGITVFISLLFFIPINIHSAGHMIFYILAASTLLSLLGLLAGVIAETFDQMAAVTSYVITPMAFLSGTFYSIDHLPAFWQKLSHLNPFFYMIDGFRYGMTGYHDGNLLIGAIYLLTVIGGLWLTVYWMIAKGYRIKH